LVRHLVLLVALAVAVNFVMPQVVRSGAAPGVAGGFRWPWLAVIGLAAAVTYAMAALSLMAASATSLRFGRTLSAQLAAAFTNRLVPAGVGAMATNVRYLERAGSNRPAAVTAVGADSLAGFVVHAIALTAAALVFRVSGQRFAIRGPDLPDDWALLVLVVVLLSVVGLATGIPRLHRRWGGAVRPAMEQLTALIRSPRRGTLLLGASAGVTAAYALALCAAVQASGGGVSLVSVVAVYLGGSALAATAPTPGGLGALEAGLIAGLTSVGQPTAAAVASVLAFRLVTYWLPVLPGAVSFWALRRSGAL
jgi:undecaprenyl-diphosphatase